MKTEAERQLAKLVSMPTMSRDIAANRAALDYVQHYLESRGMYCRRGVSKRPDALVASTRRDNLLTPAVLLLGHIDVVPAEQQMFTLRVEGDKLLGRGVYDMKFAIAGFLQLVDDLQPELNDYDFGIAIVTDEEAADQGAPSLIEAGLRPKVCVLPDSTAPNWDIEILAKGFWRFDLIAKGRTAHGGRPWEGESAAMKLLHALHELQTHFEGQNASSDSINIGKINGGEAHNMVPAEMVAGVDIRYLSAASLRQKQTIVKDICKRHDVTLKQLVLARPVATNLKHPLVGEYLESVAAVTGRQPQHFISSAGTDAPYFANVGINCIISCCEGGGHHTGAEWISRKSFLQYVPILHDYVTRVAKTSAVSVDTEAALV